PNVQRHLQKLPRGSTAQTCPSWSVHLASGRGVTSRRNPHDPGGQPEYHAARTAATDNCLAAQPVLKVGADLRCRRVHGNDDGALVACRSNRFGRHIAPVPVLVSSPGGREWVREGLL